ncbi:MAG TPA: ATP-binding protein [Fimbriimonadaceae bacterium]|nr:ATP-binding protein [Fimbriimonadaceae bacterium]
MNPESFIPDSLSQPSDAIFNRMAELLSRLYPGKFLLESESHYFLPTRYASAGLCKTRYRPDLIFQLDWQWDPKHREYAYPYNGWLEIEWQGEEFQLVAIGQYQGHCRTMRHYLLGETEEVTRAFFDEVCLWNAEVRGEVLVFDQGHWYKSSDLYDSIQSASFDNLVLEGTLKEDIQEDISGFFKAKEVYGQYGIAWKRGILFLGPPGNGKTHAVKAVINGLGRPCLYVKSLTAEYQTDQDNIGRVFERARESAPCILVLEDLDSLITKQNRSFFLNEMDGFASNDGILTLATTNHPERLDPAILERPSRFDRKYTFKLPALEERIGYLKMFSANLQPELQLNGNELALVAGATDGYSFAYLKELYLSSMMRWIAKPGARGIDQLMIDQSVALRSQMSSEAEMSDFFSEDVDEEDGNPMMAAMRMMRRFRPPRR